MKDEWLQTLWFVHILDDFMVKIKFTLNISFSMIFLQNGLVFEHFEWKSIESFVELGQWAEIEFPDQVLGLLKLVIAKKCEIIINYADNFRKIWLRRRIWLLIDLKRIFFTVRNLLDKVYKLPSKILLHFIFPITFLICDLCIVREVFFLEKDKMLLVFFIEGVIRWIIKSTRQHFNTHARWFMR